MCGGLEVRLLLCLVAHGSGGLEPFLPILRGGWKSAHKNHLIPSPCSNHLLSVGWGNPDPGSHSDRSWPPAWHNQRLPGGFEGNSIERVEAAPHHWRNWRAGSCKWDPQPLAAQPIHRHQCHRAHLEECLDVQQHAIGMRTTKAKATWQQLLSLRQTLKRNTKQREQAMQVRTLDPGHVCS